MRVLHIQLLALSLTSGEIFGNEAFMQEIYGFDHECSAEIQREIASEALIFRSLCEEDFDKGFAETLSAIRPVNLPQDRIGEIFRERLGQGIHSYVLEDAGRIIATATMIIETKFYRSGGKVAHIEDVAVHPDCQRRGFGKMIMTYLKAEAIAQGCYKMILDCSSKNVPFYESNGFKQNEVQMRMDL